MGLVSVGHSNKAWERAAVSEFIDDFPKKPDAETDTDFGN
jgi:hypothetical protein